MPDQHTPPSAYPTPLLDATLRELRRQSPAGLGTAALLSRSADVRALIAYAAGARSVDDLVAAAHQGGRGRGSGPALDLAALEPHALGELARVMVLQELRPADRTDGLALFDAVLATFGPARVAPVHQGLHCQIAYALGDHRGAAALLGTYRAVPQPIRDSLGVDLLNPYAGGSGDPARWLDSFQALLSGPAVSIAPGDGPVFDRLRSGSAPRVGSPHRISTIVTAYEPGPVLLSTIRSLIAQTWTNHEILLVDDCSPPGYQDVLAQAAALDPRVRLLRMPVNGGTYVARNAGLDAATGAFVTFQDSDDWSHPCRLERQVAPLLADPALFSTTSVGMRVTEDLVVTRPGWEQSRSYNLSSLMVRRREALDRLGYLDPVRKGADAEYVERARAVFGRPAVRHLTGAPLALIRLSPASLSSSDIRHGWMHPARYAYQSAFQTWHRRIAAGLRSPRRPARPSSRVFAAPKRLIGARETDTARYDVVLAGDWTPRGGAATAGAGRLRALVARGSRVAVLQLDMLPNLATGAKNLDSAVQDLINDGSVDQIVLSDDVRAALVVVQSPAVLHFAPGFDSRVRADRVVVEGPAIGGVSRRLAAGVCVAASRRLFGVEPRWSPSGPTDRRMLAAGPVGSALSAVDLPGTVDVRQWRLDRRGLHADRPIVGCRCAGSPAELHRMAEVLPDSERMDIRLWDGTGDARAAFGRRSPRTWLVYGPAETDLRVFLNQLDFYLHFPDDQATRDADPALLTALAAGCVLVLPHRFAPTFGEAALYCEEADIERTVRGMQRGSAFLAQSKRGREFVRQGYGHERFADRIAALLA
ncbi:MAG TPA: glycosyltransferase family 2 protein [Actinoplanes sp.]|nr:glycosyltransferase family 2 protein [Actinoplanes sp.]